MMKITPAVKLRSRNRVGLTKGSRAVNVWTIEQVKRGGSDDGFGNNLSRAEPVQLLPPSNITCIAATPRLQCAKSEPVQFRCDIPRRLGQKGRQPEKCEQADGHVDIENVAPAIGLRQPAAEHRPENGPGHHGNAPWAITDPCRSFGLMFIGTVCDSGTSAAPNKPCMTRTVRSAPRTAKGRTGPRRR